MELQLLPIDNNSQEKVEKELRAIRWQGGIDFFVAMYNNGHLSASDSVINRIARAISDNYKNVRLSNRKLVIRSSDEVAYENSIELLKNWRLAAALKRVSLEMLDASYPLDTMIIFNDKRVGVALLEEITEKEDGAIEIELKPLYSTEKIFNSNSELATNIFLRGYLHPYGEGENEAFGIRLQDVVDLDVSFIHDIEQQIIQKSFGDNI